MPSTSDGSTPDTPDATPRLSTPETRLKTACPPASDDQPVHITGTTRPSPAAFRQVIGRSRVADADLVVIGGDDLAQLDLVEQQRLFADAGIHQQEQMALFLSQQLSQEESSL